MLGIVSQVAQVLLLRELLMVFHGNELSIGLILASWLVWVGLGSRLGSTMVERTYHPLLLLLTSSAGIMLTLPATILLIRFLRGFFNLPPGAYLSLTDMALSCLLLMAPVCFLLGLQFVLLARVWRESEGVNNTNSIGKTYIGEAAGNMLGGLIFTFLFVRYLNSFQSAVLVGLLMLGAGLLIIWKAPVANQQLLRLRPMFLILILLIIAVGPFLDSLNQWAYRIQWRNFSPNHELVESYQSKHGTITVLKLEEQYSFFQSGHLVFSAAGPGAALPGLEEQEAVEFAHMSMVQHKKPESILLIGGGLRGVLGEITKHPVKKIDYIELDEMLTEAARPYITTATLKALEDSRLNLIHTDGRLFVKTAKDKYDLIIVDSPDPATAVLNRYYTLEFFREAMSLLKSDGVLVIGSVSSPDLRSTALANRNATIYHTLNSVFCCVLPAGEHFLFYFATNSPEQISLDIEVLQKRYLQRGIVTEGFSQHHYHTLLQESSLRRVNWVLRNHGRSDDAHLEGPETGPLIPPSIAEQALAEKDLPPVNQNFFINSDFKPIGYFYSLLFWDDLTRPEHAKTFKWLLYTEPWWILPPVIVSLLTALTMRIISKKKRDNAISGFAVLFAVFTTGLSTMTLQVALLFSFQSIYGFIYETIGLIVAIFMCGLALGAYLANHHIQNKAEFKILAAVQLIIALLAVLIAMALTRAATVQSPAFLFVLFSLLTFSAGLINGVDFPLSTACYLSLGKTAENTAGRVYGVELFGACAGAVLASAVVVPVLGIIACCLLAAVANGTAFIVLLISGRVKLCLKTINSRAG